MPRLAFRSGLFSRHGAAQVGRVFTLRIVRMLIRDDSFEVRTITQDDLEAVLEVYRAAIREETGLEW